MDSCNGGGAVHPVCEVKFRTKQGIAIVRGNQQVARQCLVAAIDQGAKPKELIEETPCSNYKSPKTR